MLPGGYGFGPFPLQYLELEAYSRNVRKLRPWEMQMLRELSEAFCEVHERKVRIKREQPPGVKMIDMKDPAAIKALFSKQGDRKKAKGSS